MNFSHRRGAIAFFITLGACLVVLALTLNITWVLHWREIVPLVLGIIFFGLLIAGLILNTIFLVREIRRNEKQDSFLNAVTHELKTPIASIRLYLETLQRRPVDEAQRQEFYRIMLSDSDRLLATVEQVLKAGEVRQRKRDQARIRIAMAALTNDCVAITRRRHHLDEQAITVEMPADPGRLLVSGNPADLRSAVLNILDNAVKYSVNGVHIHVKLALEHDAWVTLSITDTGMGIAPAHLKRIFKRFYRVPSRSVLKLKGTGLGLFLVRSIARQHGGDARAQSAGLGHGTTITLQLPRLIPPAASNSTSSIPTKARA
ncbi:MAG: sensor histidine kinase [Acidobacteriaceae bacterium]